MTCAVNQTQATPVDELRARLRYWLRLDPARLLWPRVCLACGDPGLDGLDLCGACVAQLPWNHSACAGCALPLPASCAGEGAAGRAVPLQGSGPDSLAWVAAQVPGTGPGDPGSSAAVVVGRIGPATGSGAAWIRSKAAGPGLADPALSHSLLPSAVPEPLLCGTCLRRRSTGRRPVLDAVHAACVYAAPVDRLLPRFKFHRDLAAGALLAQLMADAFADRPRPAALVPVPLHRSRLRRRGYDQALELARPLASALGLPLFESLLVRTRATGPQSELGAVARRRNVAGAFAVDGAAGVPAHVVLVDDVMTTGATLAAAARALRHAGVARVEAWVCARAP